MAGEVSEVRVTFMDGKVKTYRMTASPHIARFLVKEAVETGFLTIFYFDEAFSISVNEIREFRVTAVKEAS